MRFLPLLTLASALLLPAQTVVTHGPILGRPGAHEMGVWARTNRPGSFRVRYGTSPTRLDGLSDSVATSVEHDNAAWVSLDGLEAETRYYYQVVPAGSPDFSVAPDGSFRTLPDAADYRGAEHNPRGLYNLAFEYACGNNLSLGHPVMRKLPAFRSMLARIKDRVQLLDPQRRLAL